MREVLAAEATGEPEPGAEERERLGWDVTEGDLLMASSVGCSQSYI